MASEMGTTSQTGNVSTGAEDSSSTAESAIRYEALHLPDQLPSLYASLKLGTNLATGVPELSADWVHKASQVAEMLVEDVYPQVEAGDLQESTRTRYGSARSEVLRFHLWSKTQRALDPNKQASERGVLERLVADATATANDPAALPELAVAPVATLTVLEKHLTLVEYDAKKMQINFSLKEQGRRVGGTKTTDRVMRTLDSLRILEPSMGDKDVSLTAAEAQAHLALGPFVNAYVATKEQHGGSMKQALSRAAKLRTDAGLYPTAKLKYDQKTKKFSITVVGRNHNMVPLIRERARTETLGDLASRLLPTDRQLARLDIPASVKLTDIEKAFITRWAIDTHAVAFVIAQRGLTGYTIGNVIAEHTGTDEEMHGTLRTGNINITWSVSKATGFRHVDIPYSKTNRFMHFPPTRMSVNSCRQLWSNLKDYTRNFWELGLIMALVSDLCRPGLLQPVALIQQLFFGGPETVKEARSSPDGVCPVHLILEDKRECGKQHACVACGDVFTCQSVAQQVDGNLLCPADILLWAGTRPDKSRLHQSIDNQMDGLSTSMKNRYAAAKDFLDNQLADARVTGKNLYAVKVPFTKKKKASAVAIMDQISSGDGISTAGPGFSTRLFKEGGAFCLVKIMKFATDPPIIPGATTSEVPVYKNAFLPVESYDHPAAPRGLHASLDQHRRLYFKGDKLQSGHTLGNVTVLPLAFNLSKHTGAPEGNAIFTAARYISLVLAPLGVDMVEGDRKAIGKIWHRLEDLTRVNKHVDALIPHSNSKLVQIAEQHDPDLIARLKRGYGPLVAFGKDLGLSDDFYLEFGDTLTKDAALLDVPDGEDRVAGVLRDDGGEDGPTTESEVGPAEEPLTAAALLDLDNEEMRERIWGVNKPEAQRILDDDFDDEIASLETELLASMGIPEFTFQRNVRGLVEIHSVDFVAHVAYHWRTLREWCDEWGLLDIPMQFKTFWIVTLKNLQESNGVCPFTGLRMSILGRDLQAYANGHHVHGLSSFFGSQTVDDVTLLEHINFGITNLTCESRWTNYFRLNFVWSDIVAQHRVLLDLGRDLLRLLDSDLMHRMEALPGYQASLKRGQEEPHLQGFAKFGRFNSHRDLPEDHILHPSQGNAHFHLAGLRFREKVSVSVSDDSGVEQQGGDGGHVASGMSVGGDEQQSVDGRDVASCMSIAGNEQESKRSERSEEESKQNEGSEGEGYAWSAMHEGGVEQESEDGGDVGSGMSLGGD